MRRHFDPGRTAMDRLTSGRDKVVRERRHPASVRFGVRVSIILLQLRVICKKKANPAPPVRQGVFC
jgi:hypothetical protein